MNATASPKVTVLFDRVSAPLTFAAVEAIGRNSGVWSTVDVGGQEESSAGAQLIGVIADFGAADTERFLETFDRLWERDARDFVLFAPEIGKGPRPWHLLPPLHRGAFERAFALCEEAGRGALTGAITKTSERPELPEWVASRLRETLEARRLQSRVGSFGHGAESDLTNQFLAPARLLLLAPAAPDLLAKLSQGWHEIWQEFQKGVLIEARDDRRTARFGQIGQELVSAAEPIDRWLIEKDDTPCAPEHLERLMALLTECRIAAGDRAAPQPLVGFGSGTVSHVGNPDAEFRVLLIDDHANAWQPVLLELQRRLETDGQRVRFELSIDAKSVWTHGAEKSEMVEAPIHFGSYHLVLLDIFLPPTPTGAAHDGRDILKIIRDSWPNLPVVLWTTSRDIEITRKASQANGVLLKKTISWDELTDAVRIWSPRGRAVGAFSLPSVYFNHVIHEENDRELVREFFAWGLKQLDSFHALDGRVFRFFTDHGGRHIVKLLELFEKALQPFLGPGDDRVLAEDPKTREFEHLALCLAVISHELGMFPMRISGRVEDFSELAASGEGYLQAVRSLHAPRGMVLLHSAAIKQTGASRWNDADGELLGRRIFSRQHPVHADIRLGHLLAAIVGYHARFFKSLDAGKFLSWSDHAEAKFSKLSKGASEAAGVSRNQFQSTLKSLSDLLQRPPTRERVRRQCALFRFVDAIDVDASRNPAPFIILDRHRDAGNNREYLKRQIVKRIDLHDGRVDLVSLALKPTAEMMKSIATFGDDGGPSAVDLAFLLENPWSSPEARGVVKELYEKTIDDWLTQTWRAIMGKGKQGHIEGLKSRCLLAMNGTRLQVTELGKRWIATITALAVAGEIADEYSAIEESGLDSESAGIRLGRFRWADEASWSGGPPATVTILNEGLTPYPLCPRGD